MGKGIREFRVKEGAKVLFAGKPCIVVKVRTLDEAFVRTNDGDTVPARISEFRPYIETGERVIQSPDLIQVSDADWRTAEHRLELIKPMLQGRLTRLVVQQIADQGGVHLSTLYRWLWKFKVTGKVSALLPSKPTGGRGIPRLDARSEKIVTDVINQIYLNSKRKSKYKVLVEVGDRCRSLSLPVPHANTVRARLRAIDPFKEMNSRTGPQDAERKFSVHQGKFPGADYPLAVVQIDHTPVDVILVDEEGRETIGKAFLTLAIDVYSRVVVGYWLSLDPVGNFSVSMCLANMILPKDDWLAKHGLTESWPCFGIPDAIHMDNGGEFHSEMLLRISREYGISLEFRAVGKPQYGGHIERMLGTLARKIHDLPGTTFSSVHERGKYPSEKMAAMTLEDLDRWLAVQILGVYHNSPHKGIQDQAPIQRFQEAILGSARVPARGMPRMVEDPDRFRLDCLPFEERTIQRYGVEMDYVFYFAPVLLKHVLEKDPADPKHRRQFTFRRDPRDISTIYFWEPDEGRYYPIPYRNQNYPAVSLWEFKHALKTLKDQNRDNIDEEMIFSEILKARQIEEEAKLRTSRARRAKEKRRIHEAAKVHETIAETLPPDPIPCYPPEPFARRVMVPYREVE